MSKNVNTRLGTPLPGFKNRSFSRVLFWSILRHPSIKLKSS
jgi:hypothetical protein